MTRISDTFADLKARGEVALIPYITAGDPHLEMTEQLVLESVRQGADLIVRGIRAASDFENESRMALMNRRLAPGIETVFLVAGESHSFVSSRLVKEVAGFGGDISGLVPPAVARRLRDRVLTR